jgi:hypothetical protein
MIILMSKTHIPPDSLLRASRLVYVLKDYDVFQSSILIVFLFFFFMFLPPNLVYLVMLFT